MNRTVEPATFTLERSFYQAPAQVFQAFTDIDIKRRWFAEGEGWTTDSYTLDVREGGREEGTFRFEGGAPIRNETIYLDVVPDKRLVLSYCMIIDGKRISASLATVEFLPDGQGTKLIYTEQASFLDGADTCKSREEGCGYLLDTLGRVLTQQ